MSQRRKFKFPLPQSSQQFQQPNKSLAQHHPQPTQLLSQPSYTPTHQKYIKWNKEMDACLATSLYDQYNEGHKSDGNWHPKVYQVATDYINSTLHLNLRRDNIKNRLKIWKQHYVVITDLKLHQSGIFWDDEKKMVVVTVDKIKDWEAYCQVNPKAAAYQNATIENWDDIVLLCGSNKATRVDAETFDDANENMAREGEPDVDSTMDGNQQISINIDDGPKSSNKRRKKDGLAKVIKDFSNTMKDYILLKKSLDDTLQEYIISKKNQEQLKPSGPEIYEVVSQISGLTQIQKYQAVQKFINGNSEEFRVLSSLVENEKKNWVLFLIGPHNS